MDEILHLELNRILWTPKILMYISICYNIMSWQTVEQTGTIPAHAALVSPSNDYPKGAVVYFGGFNQDLSTSKDDVELFDLATNSVVKLASLENVNLPPVNIFCSGHSFLSDGRLAVGGGWKAISNVTPDPQGGGHTGAGHDDMIGVRDFWIYHPKKRDWINYSSMNFEPGHESEHRGGGRWYPTLVTLANGEVISFAGHPDETDTRHNNNTPELYLSSQNEWKIFTNPVVNSSYYPRTHLLPNGKLFFSTIVGPSNDLQHYFYDPYLGIFDNEPITSHAEMGSYRDSSNSEFSSVIFPLLPSDNYTSRILICGYQKAFKITLGTNIESKWEEAVGRKVDSVRLHNIATILPDGNILITGGTAVTKDDSTAEKRAEIYTPGVDWNTGEYSKDDEWHVDSDGAVNARGYHYVALLLPDGSVWNAGSTAAPAAVDHPDIEIYKPTYFSDQDARPEIGSDVPVSVGYNQDFTISSTDTSSIERIALIRCGSVTHAFNSDQRYVGLEFTLEQDRLTVTSPPNPAIAPPGNYMLWVIKQGTASVPNGIPCKEAKFIRICDQRCKIVANHSTFSRLEVEALLEQYEPEPAIFQQAFTVVFENFLPHELSSLGDHPDVTFKFDSENGQEVGDGMIPDYISPWWEISPPPEDIAQRKTFVFNVVFKNKDALDNIYSFQGADRRIKVIAKLGHFSYVGEFILTKTPNPYINDVHPPHPEWLSVDLRVFKKHPNEEMEGTSVVHGDSEEAPVQFIQQVLDRFRTIETQSPNDPSHPFLAITEEQMANEPLELAQEDNPDPTIIRPVYNYAIAKVRYRALTQPAENVRVFFRLFNTVDTALEFNTATTYRHSKKGNKIIPLLGMQGDDIISIPFFAEKRITPEGKMDDQEDGNNVRPILPHPGGSETVMYFGCWLDFNQPKPQIPLHPDIQVNKGNGPYENQDPISIQDHSRNHHQCLIAEIFSEEDPTPVDPPATPASSDNLSQRNLVVVYTANPGGSGSRTVQHTFEVKPSTGMRRKLDLFNILVSPSFQVPSRRVGPDELAIIRNNLPTNTKVTLYFPEIDVDDILTLAELRHAPPVFTRLDNHTISCKIGDVGYIPLPGGRIKNIPGLLSLEMPSGVVHGQLYSLTIQQISGHKPHVIGSFQLNIPVKSKEEILPKEIRKLSVLRHIAKAIPPSDRWYPIFSRYLDQIGVRVRDLGGDPDKVFPSPTGSGEAEEIPSLPLLPKERYTGKVSQLLYDCFGDFEGFILELCPGEHRFTCNERAIEEIVTRACQERTRITVYVRSTDKSRPYKIGLRCY